MVLWPSKEGVNTEIRPNAGRTKFTVENATRHFGGANEKMVHDQLAYMTALLNSQQHYALTDSRLSLDTESKMSVSTTKEPVGSCKHAIKTRDYALSIEIKAHTEGTTVRGIRKAASTHFGYVNNTSSTHTQKKTVYCLYFSCSSDSLQCNHKHKRIITVWSVVGRLLCAR